MKAVLFRSAQILCICVVALICANAVLSEQEKKLPPPKLEVIGQALQRGYLDGPAIEALAGGHKAAAVDSEGNLFFTDDLVLGGIRVLDIAKGVIRTIAGDNRWGGDTQLAEGPAAFLPTMANFGGYGRWNTWLSVRGRPLDGEKSGAIYTGRGGHPYKVFRSPAHGERWWFKKVGNPEGYPPPSKAGASISISAASLHGARVLGDKLTWEGNLYEFNERDDKLTCLLGTDDYQEKMLSILRTNRKSRAQAENMLIDGAGVTYLQYYHRSGLKGNGRVFRVSPENHHIEEIVRSGNGIHNQDGPGLYTNFHCGPFAMQGPNHTLLLTSIDSNAVRRFRAGRVSTLTLTGEWRENSSKQKLRRQDLRAKWWLWARVKGKDYIYIPYPGEERGGDSRMLRFGPFDISQPTAGVVTSQPN
jgi:hypothetical protein